jgi:hypothetical protein
MAWDCEIDPEFPTRLDRTDAGVVEGMNDQVALATAGADPASGVGDR